MKRSVSDQKYKNTYNCKNIKGNDILSQNIFSINCNEENSADSQVIVKIDYIPHKLPAKTRLPKQEKYKMNSNMKFAHEQDNRNDFECLSYIIRKLQGKVSVSAYKDMCAACNRDIVVPELLSDTLIPRYKNQVRDLIKHYKRSKTLSYGDKNVINEILEQCQTPNNKKTH